MGKKVRVSFWRSSISFPSLFSTVPEAMGQLKKAFGKEQSYNSHVLSPWKCMSLRCQEFSGNPVYLHFIIHHSSISSIYGNIS
jgi:hypothetical protein